MSEIQPFIWNGQPLPTVGDLLDAATKITDPAEAQRFMSEYRAVNPHADSNIGYVLGYIEPAERRRALYDLFQVGHPVFGGAV